MKKLYFEAVGGKPLPVGRDKNGTLAMWDQNGKTTDHINLAWSAMPLRI